MKMLLSTDGSEYAGETERVLPMIPFHPDTSVTAVYVALSTYMDIPDRFCPGLDERLQKIMAGTKEAETKHAEKAMEQARTRLMDRFQKVTVLINNGDPSEQILQAEQEKQADIVALGSRGMRGICSPVRPNPLGMSVVEVLGIEGSIIHIKGLDMIDGTPVLDIKPLTEKDD